MTASERRREIYDALLVRRKDTAANLAAEFGVSERTIRSDITELSRSYPFTTKQGRYGGGIEVENWFRPERKTLAPEQLAFLKKLAPTLEGEDLKILNSIIAQFALQPF
ncbi:HTH domain-containing protein [Butyrivibrio sp. FC2001]|uniref:HTH domain-containing protein n=1 Tax=Butyrivibrio sp. FC2001 TaxID=1280671 RepID=UPI00047D645A|nr:HTH domain-containing protein [Butyrivibrio sp. FC2001]